MPRISELPLLDGELAGDESIIFEKDGETLRGRVDSLATRAQVNALDSLIGDETAAREAAIGVIADDLAAETQARSAAVGAVQTGLDAEREARVDAVGAVEESLASETQTRAQAVIVLQDADAALDDRVTSQEELISLTSDQDSDLVHELLTASGFPILEIFREGLRAFGLAINAPPRPDEPFLDGVSGFWNDSGFWPFSFTDDGWDLPGGARMRMAGAGIEIVGRNGNVILRSNGDGASFGGLDYEPIDDALLQRANASGFVWEEITLTGERLGIGGSDVVIPELADITPICGGDLALVSDRPLPIHIPALFKSRSDDAPAIVTISSRKGFPLSGTHLSASGGTVMLDPARIGPVTTIAIRRKGDRANFLTRNLVSRVKQVPVTNAPTKYILVNGDSISNRQAAYYLKLLLESWGYSVVFIGTMNGDGAAPGTGPLGEAREGWGHYDWLGIEQDSDWTNVVPVGGESAYLALANADKLRWHPALNPDLSTLSQCPIVTIGGVQYRFDFAFYLERFGLSTPTDFAINLAMNDLLEKAAATSLAQVIAGYGYLLTEYRRVAPTAKIVLWATDMPNTAAADANWAEWTAILAAVEKIVRDRQAAGDTNIFLCSAWLHQSPEPGGWPATVGAADPATGWSTGTISDSVHPAGIGREQPIEALGAHIAN